MTRFKPYESKKPGQVQKRAILLTDQERYQISKQRHVDLFGLDSWEECSQIKNSEQFHEYCNKHGIMEGGLKRRYG